MSIVDFNSATWTDPWFRKLPRHGKLLFLYLWTNNHKNLSGLYAIDIATMAFETGLTEGQVKDALLSLDPKVMYDYENDVVWVVNHVKHQFMKTSNVSPKIIVGIEKALLALNQHPYIKEFLTKYWELHILYPYPIENSGYPSGEGGGEGEGSGKGGGEGYGQHDVDLN